MKIKLITIALLITFSGYAAADFKCKVVSSVTVDKKNGKLQSLSSVANMRRGNEFTVNRLTGIMTGGGFVNNKSGATPIVYNYTYSVGNNYSVVTIYTPSYTMDSLEISEWIKGKNKPFLFKGAFG